MIKIYEILKQNSAKLVFNYVGVTLNVSFENGNTFNNKNASFTTNNKFFQDAIENDSRFGISIILKRTIEEDSDKVVEEKPKAEAKAKKPAAKKESLTFDTVNDFMAYVSEQGDAIDDPDKLDAYLKKYNATIKG